MLIWGVVAVLSCVVVLWMSGLFGRPGALGTGAAIVAVHTGLWLAFGPAGFFYLVAFALPSIFGVLIGILIWYRWSRRRRLTKVLKG